MSTRRSFECFGLVIHGYDWLRTLEHLDEHVRRVVPTWIVTANPEILLAAKREAGYWQTVRQADLRLVDGVGLQLAGRLAGASPKRMTGVALAERLVALAAERGWNVALVGGGGGVADTAAWKLRKRYPTLTIVAEQGGAVDDSGVGDAVNDETVHRLTLQTPDVLLVAFGHPKQEEWIRRNLDALPGVKVAVGIGGTFDYWTGTAAMAPTVIRRIGLEWLWRLIREPRRWRRILDAVVVFPWVFVLDRLRRPKST
ncbi:WecB/TagA/CpsF family glycosyltransferase [Patescibacteria group bacterium]|nr:WecB/TagA/CpsF family glycosyltransferase [Patescibacteria group bacterium]